jgi:hypothetical protein
MTIVNKSAIILQFHNTILSNSKTINKSSSKLSINLFHNALENLQINSFYKLTLINLMRYAK